MSSTCLERLIIGHGQAAALLDRALDQGRLSHAYLFLGPPRVGKATLARSFARALNCSGDPRPCGECRACRLAERAAYPDLWFIQGGRSDADEVAPPREKVGDRTPTAISIDQIRKLQSDTARAPVEGAWKAYILADLSVPRQLSLDAANCLLKTLEEPPPRVVLLLTAEETEALLPTIVSRCQPVRLAPVPTDELAGALRERWRVEPDRAELLAHLSAGRPGWALAALADPKVVAERDELVARLLALLAGSRTERFAYAERLAQDYGRDPERTAKVLGVLDLWLGWWRDVLLARTGCEELIVDVGRLEELRRRARSLTVAEIRAAIRAVESTLQYLAQNVNPRLALESLLLGLPQGGG